MAVLPVYEISNVPEKGRPKYVKECDEFQDKIKQSGSRKDVQRI